MRKEQECQRQKALDKKTTENLRPYCGKARRSCL